MITGTAWLYSWLYVIPGLMVVLIAAVIMTAFVQRDLLDNKSLRTVSAWLFFLIIAIFIGSFTQYYFVKDKREDCAARDGRLISESEYKDPKCDGYQYW